MKMHTVLDYDVCLLVFTAITQGSVHEINVARKLSFPVGSVVVMDRGHVDYRWLSVLDSNLCFFTTRAKSNMAYQILQDNTHNSGNNAFILADQSYCPYHSKGIQRLSGNTLSLPITCCGRHRRWPIYTERDGISKSSLNT